MASKPKKGTKRKEPAPAATAAAPATSLAAAADDDAVILSGSREVKKTDFVVSSGGGGGGGGSGEPKSRASFTMSDASGESFDVAETLSDSLSEDHSPLSKQFASELILASSGDVKTRLSAPISSHRGTSFKRWKEVTKGYIPSDVVDIMDGYHQILSANEKLMVETHRRSSQFTAFIESFGTEVSGNRIVGTWSQYLDQVPEAVSGVCEGKQFLCAKYDRFEIGGVPTVRIRIDDMLWPPFYAEAIVSRADLQEGRAFTRKASGRHGNFRMTDPAAFVLKVKPPSSLMILNTAHPACWFDVSDALRLLAHPTLDSALLVFSDSV